jgi:hypothetical protein
MLKAGSLVFTPRKHPVDLRDWSQWWKFKFGANWRRPYDLRSSIGGIECAALKLGSKRVIIYSDGKFERHETRNLEILDMRRNTDSIAFWFKCLRTTAVDTPSRQSDV